MSIPKMEVVNLWHIIDGEFVHLCQRQAGNEISFYTNGILEGTRKIDDDGTFLKIKEESNG